ncbi:MAG: penicillin-binding transpeptidase domain-containing protein, partial [SAR324 cluster bacterium]|nr:penicillin-binding transpeptidase domain-containing protein [SAR324 cluster bacterium]
AVSLPMSSIYVIPQEIENPYDAAGLVAALLGVNEAHLSEAMTSTKSFTWVKRYVTPVERDQVMGLGIKGIYFLKEYERFYPKLNLASHVIGFTGMDSRGLEGLEFKYNEHLMNSDIHNETWNPLVHDPRVNPLSGGSIELTIDATLQHLVDTEISKATQGMKAKFGVAILMDSQTSEILSLSAWPNYDPNNFQRYNKQNFFNNSVGLAYEPGSTFKLVTMATALESGAIAKDNLFYCEKGTYQIHDREIHDTHPYGFLSLEQIIQKSSNICAAKIAQLIDRPTFYQSIQKFGFGQKTDLGLGGEVSGKLHHFGNWNEITVATLSYGHSISATPIQVLAATNVFANGGKWVQPKIIKSLKKADGTVIPIPKQRRVDVVSPEVATQVKDYMKSVVKLGGTGFKAHTDGLEIAGKTGTTRKFDSQLGAYSNSLHTSSFVGFFPADKPRLTLFVLVDEPSQRYLGSKSASVVFKMIVNKVKNYYPLEGPEHYPATQEKTPFATGAQTAALAGEQTGGAQEKLTTSELTRKVIGKSLREALAFASTHEMNIKLKGNGKVAQAEINKNTLTLTLSDD